MEIDFHVILGCELCDLVIYSTTKCITQESQHDSACRLIARLKKELDEDMTMFVLLKRQAPMCASTTAPTSSTLINGTEICKLNIEAYTSKAEL